MPSRLGFGHLILFRFDCLSLLGNPLLSRRQRLLELLSGALVMPVGADDLLAAIVGIERPMGNHALEAVCLSLVAGAVYPWPLAHLYGVLDLWRCPVHQGFALSGLDDDKMSRIIRPGHFPRPTIDPRAILKRADLGGLKACQTLMLIVVEHREQATALGLERTGQRYRVDRPVDDKEGCANGFHHLLAVLDDDRRSMQVGWIIRQQRGRDLLHHGR